jgi:hypothetical protein
MLYELRTRDDNTTVKYEEADTRAVQKTLDGCGYGHRDENERIMRPKAGLKKWQTNENTI